MADEPKIRMVMADDHTSLVEGMVAVIQTYDDVEMVGTASNGKDALHLCRRTRPDVLLLDIELPGNGLEIGPEVLELPHPPRLIYFSGHAKLTYVLQAIGLGASGYLLKDESTVDVLDAVCRVAREGRSAYSYQIRRVAAAMNVGGVSRRKSDPVLGDQERKVVRLHVRGLTFKAVGDKMNIAPGTVRTHWERAITKLGLRPDP